MAEVSDVIPAAHHVMQHARSVHIDTHAVGLWAGRRANQVFPRPQLPPQLRYQGDRASCANLALLQSCLNFCFWSERPWVVEFEGRKWTRTYAMLAALLRAIREAPEWLQCRRWIEADHQAVASLFHGDGEIPLLLQRRQVLNETGQVLAEHFAGQCVHLIEHAGSSAPHLASALARYFPSFRDVASYQARPVPFLKRAQLCAADLTRLWNDNRYDGLAGMNQLTLLADYRIPQFLRHEGLMKLAPVLAERIETGTEIAAGCPEEIELRCATIWCGELICRALPSAMPAWQLDYYLWMQARSQPMRYAHHRTRTVYY